MLKKAEVANTGRPPSPECLIILQIEMIFADTVCAAFAMHNTAVRCRVALKSLAGLRFRAQGIRGISSRRHEYPADTKRIVTGVEGPPTVAQVDFKPCAEIHGQQQRDADITEIACGIPGRNVHRAAKRDRKMLEIPADPLALRMYVQCRFGGIGKVITECDVLMNPVTDGLHRWPPGRRIAE
jgi:hypothetical protein